MIYLIGRTPGADIVIADNTVSARHAQLVIDADGYVYINDLNSTNGTFVNGNKITSSVRLLPEDQVMLGKFPFQWQGYLVAKDTSTEADKNVQLKTIPKTRRFSTLTAVLISTMLFAIIGISAYLLNEQSAEDSAIATNSKGSKDSTVAQQNDTESTSGSDQMDNEGDKRNKHITHDLSCLRDDKDPLNTTDMINFGSEIHDEMIKMTGPAVSPQEEMQVGEQVKQEFYRSPGIRSNKRLNDILKRMIAHLGSSAYRYEVFELMSEEINAFTIGGKIFVASGMLKFVKNDNELAAIIGHEIYHNELGHIKKKLQANNLAREILGNEIGNLATQLHSLFSTPFNQKDEAHCDLHGLDLVVKAGYDPCGSVDLWERMSKNEGDFNPGENMLRSHPFSTKRRECSHHHLQQNYNKQCR